MLYPPTAPGGAIVTGSERRVRPAGLSKYGAPGVLWAGRRAPLCFEVRRRENGENQGKLREPEAAPSFSPCRWIRCGSGAPATARSVLPGAPARALLQADGGCWRGCRFPPRDQPQLHQASGSRSWLPAVSTGGEEDPARLSVTLPATGLPFSRAGTGWFLLPSKGNHTWANREGRSTGVCIRYLQEKTDLHLSVPPERLLSHPII